MSCSERSFAWATSQKQSKKKDESTLSSLWKKAILQIARNCPPARHWSDTFLLRSQIQIVTIQELRTTTRSEKSVQFCQCLSNQNTPAKASPQSTALVEHQDVAFVSWSQEVHLEGCFHCSNFLKSESKLFSHGFSTSLAHYQYSCLVA